MRHNAQSRAYLALHRRMLADPLLCRAIIDDMDRHGQQVARIWAGLDSHGTPAENVHNQPLDSPPCLGNNAAVPFNSGTGFGDPIPKADSRRTRHFLRPSHTIGASFSMAGGGGETFGSAGVLWAGSPTLPHACHPRLATGGGSKRPKEAAMPKSISRALSHLFPAIARPVATFPLEAEAVSFARAYLAQAGRPVSVAPATDGFDVVAVGGAR